MTGAAGPAHVSGLDHAGLQRDPIEASMEEPHNWQRVCTTFTLQAPKIWPTWPGLV